MFLIVSKQKNWSLDTHTTPVLVGTVWNQLTFPHRYTLFKLFCWFGCGSKYRWKFTYFNTNHIFVYSIKKQSKIKSRRVNSRKANKVTQSKINQNKASSENPPPCRRHKGRVVSFSERCFSYDFFIIYYQWSLRRYFVIRFALCLFYFITF